MAMTHEERAAALYGRDVGTPDLTSLPATVNWLRDSGLLLETDVEVNPDLELIGIQKGLDGSYPILFNTVQGFPHVRALTNLFANYGIIERMYPELAKIELSARTTRPGLGCVGQ